MSGLSATELAASVQRAAIRDAERRHRHVYAVVGPSELLPGFDLERCTREGCEKIHHRRREAS